MKPPSDSTFQTGFATRASLLVLLACTFLAGCKSPAPVEKSAPRISTGTNAIADLNASPATAEANQLAPSPPETFPPRDLPTLFLVGDSTVHNAAPGLLGWGDVIGRYFDTNQIIVENHARPGRSSRTFQTQGWWTNVLAAARPGDYVMIQLGHNDEGQLADTNRARGTIRGLGEESTNIYNTVRQLPETVHTYGWYMRKFISDARAHRMTPIICSPVPRLPKATVVTATDTNSYVNWSGEIAKSQRVFFINLNQLILTNYVGMTPPEIKTKYYTTQDSTHFNPTGAELNALCVIKGLNALKECQLNTFLFKNPSVLGQTNNLSEIQKQP